MLTNKNLRGITLKSKQISEKNYLVECFDCILIGNSVHLNTKNVAHIIANELQISLSNITSSMKSILYECLCYYMKVWPGWKTYRLLRPDTKARESFLNKFKEYLTRKLRYVMENEMEFYSSCSPADVKLCENIPEYDVQKTEAPYTLVISGKPFILNNIGFLESHNDIVIQPHMGRPWKCLNIRQFLNYPFIEISLKLPDLELTRQNSHLFTRYISNYESIECPTTSYIDFVRRNELGDKVNVYTIDFISAYCKQFIELIKTQYQVDKCKVLELEMIFKQFLLDVVESDIHQSLLSSGKMVNTMATNVTVCFNIGGHTYLRSKKSSVTDDHIKKNPVNIISFSEIIIPKMTFTLKKFVAEEDDQTTDITFKSLNEMADKLVGFQEKLNFGEVIQNSVSYSCLLCSITCHGKNAYHEIIEHFRSFHKGGQTVVCCKCQKEFAIANLAGSRWAHDCKKQQGTSISSASLNKVDTVQHSENVTPVQNVTSNSLQRGIFIGDGVSQDGQQNGESSILEKCITDECVLLNSIPKAVLSGNTLPINTVQSVEVCNMPFLPVIPGVM